MLGISGLESRHMTETIPPTPAETAPKRRRARRVGPNSRRSALAALDQRTREARLLRRMEAELTRHVGGTPSATQRALIARCAMLTLHVAMLDGRALQSGGMTAHDQRAYLAFSNSLSRSLRDLGLDPAAAAPPSLSDLLRAPPPNHRAEASRKAPEPAQDVPGTMTRPTITTRWRARRTLPDDRQTLVHHCRPPRIAGPPGCETAAAN
jgi:hypothetical protein